MSLVARSAMRSNSGSSGNYKQRDYTKKPMTCTEAKELACTTLSRNPKLYGAEDSDHVKLMCYSGMGNNFKSDLYKNCLEWTKKEKSTPAAWKELIETPEVTTGGRRRRKSSRKSRRKSKKRKSRKRRRTKKKRKKRRRKRR